MSNSTTGSDGEALSPWLTRHAVLVLVAGALTLAVPTGAWVALAATVSFAGLILRERRRLLKPHGYANQLTMLRLTMLLAAAGFIGSVPILWLWALLAANVALDVADGYVARRMQQASSFGAVFDREVDALFVLVAYLYFHIAEGMHAAILAPGFLPYLYRIATLARRDRQAPDHREKLAATLAGANFVVLLVAVGAPPNLQLPLVILSVVLVGTSFAASFLRLWLNAYSTP